MVFKYLVNMDDLERYLGILGWSQAELGRRIGVSKTSVSSWSVGRHPVPKVVLLYLELLCRLKGEIL